MIDNLKVRLVLLAGRILGVPVHVHQTFFMKEIKDRMS